MKYSIFEVIQVKNVNYYQKNKRTDDSSYRDRPSSAVGTGSLSNSSL